MVKSSMLMLGEQRAFCSTASGVLSPLVRRSRVPKKMRLLGSPSATGTPRLRPSSGISSRSNTLAKSSGV